MFHPKLEKFIIVLFIVLCGATLFSDYAIAADATQDANILSSITLKFQSKATLWSRALQAYAFALFRILLIADVCLMGIRLALKQAEIQEVLVEFIRLILFAAFMFTVVCFHKEWANDIIQGLGKIAEIDLGAPPMEPGSIFWAGLEVVNKIWKEISFFSNPINGLGYVIFGIALTIIFALITAQVVLIKCEAYIVLNAGTILLGFGGSRLTKDYAINFLRYSLAIAVKLFVMQLLVSLAISFTNDLSTAPATYEDLAVVIGASIVLLALTMVIPDICAGIINGSHVNTGQAITSAVTAVSTATMALTNAVKQAGGAKNAVDAIREANKFANDSGASGVGKAAHMAKSLHGAAKAAKSPTFGEDVASGLRAQREAFNMEQEADQGDE